MSTVVTLAKSLPYGHKLRRGDFKEIPWPSDAIPPGAFRSIGDLFAAHDSPIAKFELSEGEVMLPAKINLRTIDRPYLCCFLRACARSP